MSDSFLIAYAMVVALLLFGCGGEANGEPDTINVNVPKTEVTVTPPIQVVRPIFTPPGLDQGKEQEHGHHVHHD